MRSLIDLLILIQLSNVCFQALEEEEEEDEEEKSKDDEDESKGSILSKSLLLLQTKDLATGENVESQLMKDSEDSRREKVYSALKWGR